MIDRHSCKLYICFIRTGRSIAIADPESDSDSRVVHFTKRSVQFSIPAICTRCSLCSAMRECCLGFKLRSHL